jgi:hypothetical protein
LTFTTLLVLVLSAHTTTEDLCPKDITSLCLIIMTSGHTFLFEPTENKQPRTARKVHIRRLYDVLELCLHRGDMRRAQRAWSILVRCKEIEWKTMWRTGALVVGTYSPHEGAQVRERLEYLSTMMRQHTAAVCHSVLELMKQNPK